MASEESQNQYNQAASEALLAEALATLMAQVEDLRNEVTRLRAERDTPAPTLIELAAEPTPEPAPEPAAEPAPAAPAKKKKAKTSVLDMDAFRRDMEEAMANPDPIEWDDSVPEEDPTPPEPVEPYQLEELEARFPGLSDEIERFNSTAPQAPQIEIVLADSVEALVEALPAAPAAADSDFVDEAAIAALLAEFAPDQTPAATPLAEQEPDEAAIEALFAAQTAPAPSPEPDELDEAAIQALFAAQAAPSPDPTEPEELDDAAIRALLAAASPEVPPGPEAEAAREIEDLDDDAIRALFLDEAAPAPKIAPAPVETVGLTDLRGEADEEEPVRPTPQPTPRSGPDPAALAAVDAGLAATALLLPISLSGTQLTARVAEPVDQEALRAFEAATGLTVQAEPTPLAEVVAGLRAAYSDPDGPRALVEAPNAKRTWRLPWGKKTA